MTAAKALNPESIYFGGVTATGGARILKLRSQVGLGDIPYVGPDGINDGSGATEGLVPQPRRRRRQELATARSPASATSRPRPSSTRTTRPSTASTPPATRRTGYACAQVVIDAIDRAWRPSPADMTALREAVREARHRHRPTRTRPSSATSRSTRTATPSQKIISIYSVDPAGRRQGRLGVRDPGRLRRKSSSPRPERGRGAIGSPASLISADLVQDVGGTDVTTRGPMPRLARRSDSAAIAHRCRPSSASSSLSSSSSVLQIVGRRALAAAAADRQRAVASARSTRSSRSATRWSTASSSSSTSPTATCS